MISIFHARNRHVFTEDSLRGKKVQDVVHQIVEPEDVGRAVLTCDGKPIDCSTQMETLFEESAVFLVVIPKSPLPEMLTKPIDNKALDEVIRMINGYSKQYDKRLISGAVQEVVAHDFLGILIKTYPELLYVPSEINVFRDSRILLTMLFEESDKAFARIKQHIPLFLGFKTLLRLMKNPISKQLNIMDMFSNLTQMAGEDQEPALPIGGGRLAPVALPASDSAVPNSEAGPSREPRAPAASGNPVTREMLTEAIAFAMNSGQNARMNPIFNAIPPTYDDDEMASDEEEEGGDDRNNVENYRTLFRSQLERLIEFGFEDEDENIRALIAAAGDLDFALNIIISARENM